jgi:hypothetical protein
MRLALMCCRRSRCVVLLELYEVHLEDVSRGGHQPHLLRTQTTSQLLHQVQPRQGVGDRCHLGGREVQLSIKVRTAHERMDRWAGVGTSVRSLAWRVALSSCVVVAVVVVGRR